MISHFFSRCYPLYVHVCLSSCLNHQTDYFSDDSIGFGGCCSSKVITSTLFERVLKFRFWCLQRDDGALHFWYAKGNNKATTFIGIGIFECYFCVLSLCYNLYYWLGYSICVLWIILFEFLYLFLVFIISTCSLSHSMPFLLVWFFFMYVCVCVCLCVLFCAFFLTFFSWFPFSCHFLFSFLTVLFEFIIVLNLFYKIVAVVLLFDWFVFEHFSFCVLLSNILTRPISK